jgi:hypothetical protein
VDCQVLIRIFFWYGGSNADSTELLFTILSEVRTFFFKILVMIIDNVDFIMELCGGAFIRFFSLVIRKKEELVYHLIMYK